MDWQGLTEFANRGGPALWVIGILSIFALSIIMWKIVHLFGLKAFKIQQNANDVAISLSEYPDPEIEKNMSMTGKLAYTAKQTLHSPHYSDQTAREETTRVAKNMLFDVRIGLRPLELIANISPLIGLFGTVLGMISAFQALQIESTQADPSILAGGIWEALLTTAAGMFVAIFSSIALTWFEAIAERLQAEMEDVAAKIFAQSNLPQSD